MNHIENTPFPHIVYDNICIDTCLSAARDWPSPDWTGWNAVYSQKYQQKRACNQWDIMPDSIKILLSSMLFLDVSMFTTSSNKTPLIPDTLLWGGGMHDMGRGGCLGIHLDANIHKLIGLHRVLNGILFINPEWEESWGGALEFWSKDKTHCVKKIYPKLGRLVLFHTNDSNYHGVPEPLQCPTDVSRKTLAVWWYNNSHLQGKHYRDRAKFIEEIVTESVG